MIPEQDWRPLADLGFSLVPGGPDRFPKKGLKWSRWEHQRQTEQERTDIGLSAASTMAILTGQYYGLTVLDFDNITKGENCLTLIEKNNSPTLKTETCSVGMEYRCKILNDFLSLKTAAVPFAVRQNLEAVEIGTWTTITDAAANPKQLAAAVCVLYSALGVTLDLEAFEMIQSFYGERPISLNLAGVSAMVAWGLVPNVVTGSGGAHVWIEAPDFPVKTCAGQIGPGIDVRGEGGIAWCLGHASKHPRPYQLLHTQLTKLTHTAPPEQKTLYDTLKQVEKLPDAPLAPAQPFNGDGAGTADALRVLRQQADRVLLAEPGTSNTVFNRAVVTVAGLVTAGELDETNARAILLDAAEERGVQDIPQVFASAWSSGAARPWKLPTSNGSSGGFETPKPEFAPLPAAPPDPKHPGWAQERLPVPLDAFPDDIRDMIVHGAPATACAPEFLAASLLPAMASAAGGFVTLDLASGWRIPPSFFVGLVGPPGASKTPAWSRAIAPIREAQRSGFQNANDTGIPGQRYMVDDTTVEKLEILLSQYPRGLLAAVDELKAFFEGHGQYKKASNRDRQFWLSVWSGVDIIVDRISRDTLIIPNPTMSVIGGIQPQVFAGATISEQDGMWPRFLLVYSDPLPGKKWNRPSQEFPRVLERYHEHWNDVRDSGFTERKLYLSEDGFDAWESWYNRHYDTTPPLALEATWTKVETHVARTALTLAVWEQEKQVTADHVHRAVQIVQWFLSHAMYISRVVELFDPAEEKYVRNRQRLSEYLLTYQQDHGTLPTRRRVLQYGPSGSRRGTQLDIYLNDLRIVLPDKEES